VVNKLWKEIQINGYGGLAVC